MRKSIILYVLVGVVGLLVLTACADHHTQEIEKQGSSEKPIVITTTEASFPSLEERLVSLFQAEPQAGLSIEDVTFLGKTISNLTLEDAVALAGQNGFAAESVNEDGRISYQASYIDRISPCVNIYQFKGIDILYLSIYHDTPPGEFWTRDETDPTILVGINNIQTFDSLESVLAEFNYTNSIELAATIHEVFTLPSEDAIAILSNLHSYGFCCETEGYGVSADTDRVTEWTFYWNGIDSPSQKEYKVGFRFLVKDDCLTSVIISRG